MSCNSEAMFNSLSFLMYNLDFYLCQYILRIFCLFFMKFVRNPSKCLTYLHLYVRINVNL